MRRHIKERRIPRIGIPLTPLIDIVFLLLIYFLLTTNFMVRTGMAVNLPASRHAAPIDGQEIAIAIQRGGALLLNGEPVDSATLLKRLRALMDVSSGEDAVVIRADRDVALKEAVAAMDIAKAAGVRRLSLETERSWVGHDRHP
jgi:biopolymer transport protein ExbD